MLIAALVVLNIPVYLLIGWLVFDTKEDASDTLFDTVVVILKAIFMPPIVRVLRGEDLNEGMGSTLMVGAFLVACVLVVAGEYYVITQYIWTG